MIAWNLWSQRRCMKMSATTVALMVAIEQGDDQVARVAEVHVARRRR